MARSTAAAGMPLPATVKCMWILVKTLGSFSARSLVSLTLQRSTWCRPALEDQHHVVGGAAAGAGQHGFHRPRRQVLSAVFRLGRIRRAIHHQDVAAAGLGDESHRRSRARVAGPAHCAFHLLADSREHGGWQKSQPPWICVGKASPACCNRNKQSVYFISSHTNACAPVVSSTLPIGGFSPEPQGPGLFSWAAQRAHRRAYDRGPMPKPTAPLTPADYLKKILTARVYDVAVESALEPARALSAPTGQHGAAQARGPAAGLQLQAARRLQQDGAPERPSSSPTRRDLRLGRQPCPGRGARRPQAGRARRGRDAGDHAAAQGRRGARARRRSASARRQLFRRLRATRSSSRSCTA